MKVKKIKRIGLIIFDMDGVILREPSSWQILHRIFNVDSSRNLKLYLEGRISYREFLERDVRLWKENYKKPITRGLLREILGSNLNFNLGVEEAVGELRSRGLKLAIVTCGLELLGEIVCNKLGISNFLGNSLEFDSRGVLLDSGKVRVPLLDKDLVVEAYSKILGFKCDEEVAYIGDSIFDVPVFKKVALSIAYSKDPRVVSHATASFYGDMRKLIEVLEPYIQSEGEV